MTVTKTNEFVKRARTQSTNFLVTLSKLRMLREEWDKLDYLNQMNDADIGGENDGIVKADVSAVLGTTLDALETLLASGHLTNLYKLIL